MTSRFRSSPVNFSVTEPITTRTSGGAYVTNNRSGGSVSRTKSMTDVITPGYFAAKRTGSYLPMNTMSKTDYKIVTNDFGVSEWWQWLDPAVYPSYAVPYNSCKRTGNLAFDAYIGHSGQGSQIFPTFQGTTPTWPNSSNLLVKALANANAHGWDVGTFMVELHKTVDMIRNFRENTFLRANRIARDLDYKKFRFRTGQEVLSAFSQTWLEARYGWRNLIFDMQDINIALIKLADLQHDYVRATERETASASRAIFGPTAMAFTATPAGFDSGLISRATIEISQVAERKISAGVMLQGVAGGLAFADPFVTGWEIVPFSFVVDWFTNIGDNVAAFSPTMTGSLLHGFIVSQDIVRTTTVCTPLVPGTAGIFKTSVSGPTAYKLITESIIGERYPQSPSFSLDLKVNLSTEKIVDLASIFFLKYNKLLGTLYKSVRL